MEFIPEGGVIGAYSIACVVLYITPGPNMSLTLSKTISGGRLAGVAAFVGSKCGVLVHTLLAAFGVSALIAASPKGFMALKIGGAVYLLWMAYDAVCNGSALSIGRQGAVAVSHVRTFFQGVGINLTNPKIILFFITFLPQFVDGADPNAPAKLVFLGVFYIAVALPLGFSIIAVADGLVRLLQKSPHIIRGIDYFFAAVFCIFAVNILRIAAP